LNRWVARTLALKAAWVKRNLEAVFDPWKFEPDIVVGDLTILAAALGRSA
jgi:2-haloacid dehalogenase